MIWLKAMSKIVAEYMPFSSTYRTFTKIEYTLHHKVSTNFKELKSENILGSNH